MLPVQPSHDPQVRDHLTADHRELERLLTRVISAFETGDRSEVASTWALFDKHLLAHFEVEESHLIPHLIRNSPRAAAAILAEHRHLRARLLELGAGVDLHVVDLRMARLFIDELRAHAAHEDRMLYRWSDEQTQDSSRRLVLQALGVVPSID